ncbi:hypothetical protein [Dysgonomonas termitidis]|uniref:Uncharacterized protein n=1 Tax=Dysgonomonas termitidis TaxID=1516126 RepID=A0ABV9KUX6_9BACT
MRAKLIIAGWLLALMLTTYKGVDLRVWGGDYRPDGCNDIPDEQVLAGSGQGGDKDGATGDGDLQEIDN